MLKTAFKIIFFLARQSKIEEVKSSIAYLIALIGLMLNALYLVIPLLILNIDSYYSGSLIILDTEPGSARGVTSVVLMFIPVFLETMIMNTFMIIVTSAILGLIMSKLLTKERISFRTTFQLMLLHSFLVSVLILLPFPGFYIYLYLIGGMILRTLLLKRELAYRNKPARYTPLSNNLH